MISNLIRENIKNLKPYSSARDEFKDVNDEFKDVNDEFIFLDANENPFNNGLNRYPDPQQKQLKNKISEIKNVSEKNILLGNGSDEVLDLIFRVFCEPKQDNIITLPPTYGMYEVLANTNAIEIKTIVLTDDFQPNVDEILSKQNNNSKLLFLCSPNNPTGNCFEDDKIEKLLNEFKGIVLIDEAYIDFNLEKSWLKRLEEFPNLIITQTLSKAYGLAGIRLGVCYASEEIISVLNKIKPPYNINQLTQLKALEILSKTDEIQEKIEIILSERVKLTDNLKAIEFVKEIYKTEANFILIKVDNAELRYAQLLKNGIVVRNRSNQVLCDNCLRISIGNPSENKRLINILKKL